MILVVDDRPENLLPLRKILEQHGFLVDTALSGEEALKKSLQNDYSLVILDVQMPGMDGFEVAEALRGYSKTNHIPVIFLSAIKVEKKFISKGYSSGGIDYVTKPIDNDIFLLKVRNLYQLSTQTKQLIETKKHLEKEVEIRRNTEFRLKEALTELQSTLESLPQLAFISNEIGVLEYVNSKWKEYAPDERSFPDFDPEHSELLKKWNEAIKSGTQVHFEVKLKRQNENVFRWHLLKAVPVKENDTIIKWVGTFTDIEEQKRVETRKDEFLSIASHELKTPLTSLKAYFQLIQRSVNDQFPATIKTYITKTSEQLDKLNMLIADLLDISRIQNGKIFLKKEQFDFPELLFNVIETIREVNPDWDIEYNGPDHATVVADKERIEQVLQNYLSNAIKYSPAIKKISLSASINEDNTELKMSVRDYGIGIPKDKQPFIFDKFYRVEDDSIRFQGMGIGLFISAEIIKRHGGTYGVESEPGNGSTFYFTLPM